MQSFGVSPKPQARRACSFCGSATNKIDNEHVWGKWYSRWLYEAGVIQNGTELQALRGPIGDLAEAGRAQGVNLKIRRTCQACNGGWMSDLEEDAKAIFIPNLIVRGPTKLSPYDQLDLAAWATMLAMEFDLSVTAGRSTFFQAAERDWLRVTRTPPARTTIWLGKHMAHELLAWAFGSDLSWNLPTKGTESPTATGYVLTFTIGLAVIQVLSHRLPPNHHPVSNPTLATPGVFNQIWPVLERLHYNPPEAFNRDELTLITSRWASVTTPVIA